MSNGQDIFHQPGSDAPPTAASCCRGTSTQPARSTVRIWTARRTTGIPPHAAWNKRPVGAISARSNPSGAWPIFRRQTTIRSSGCGWLNALQRCCEQLLSAQVLGPTSPKPLLPVDRYHRSGRACTAGPCTANPNDYVPVFNWTTYPERPAASRNLVASLCTTDEVGDGAFSPPTGTR